MSSPLLHSIVPDLFHLTNYEVHGAIDVDPGPPLRICTNSQPWNYALSLPVRKSRNHDELLAPKAVLVRITATVRSGSISIGALRHDGTSFLDQMVRSADGQRQEFRLCFGPLSDCDRIMIRNGDRGPSSLVIHDLQSFEVSLEPLQHDVLPEHSSSRLMPVKDWQRVYGNYLDGLEEHCRSVLYRSLQESKPMDWLDGLKLEIHPNNEMSRAIFISGQYEPNSLIVFGKLLSAARIVLDVGANAGYYSLFASRNLPVGGKVFAFEPSDREYQQLLRNISMNDCANVFPCRKAVSDFDGSANLLLGSAYHSGHNTLADRFGYENVENAGVQSVATTTIDGFVADNALKSVDVIKMDIEGGECRALRGSIEVLEKHRPLLMLEISEPHLLCHGTSTLELGRLVERLGYRTFEIDNHSAELISIENLSDARSENVVLLPSEKVSRILGPDWPQSPGSSASGSPSEYGGLKRCG